MGLFREIPAHNQMDVLKKLDFKDFVKFKQCSRETVEIGSKFRYRLPMDVSSIYFHQDTFKLCKKVTTRELDLKTISEEPVRFNLDKCSVGSLCCQEINVEDFCRKMKLQADMLAFNEEHNDNFEIDSSTIDRILKLLRSTALYTVKIPLHFIAHLEQIHQITEIHFYGEIEQSEFLQLNTPVISFREANLPLSAINKFLKQWLEDNREIYHFAIVPIPEDHLDFFKDIEFTIIWSTEEETPLKFKYINDLDVVYSIQREDGKKLAVAMEKSDERILMAMEYEDEEEVKEWIDWIDGEKEKKLAL